MEKKTSTVIGKLQRTFSSQVTRAEAGQHCGHLEKFIELTGAFSGIQKNQFLPIYQVASLGDLITDTRHDSLLKKYGLWMYKKREPEEKGYLGTCDLEIIQQLREKRKALFISHICREPLVNQLPLESEPTGDRGFGGSPLEACLLVTVYSFIQQLLQLKFSPDEDDAKVNISDLDSLKLENSCWIGALNMLESLLWKTPSLEFCVLYWLPALDDNTHTEEKSKDLLNLLYKYKELHGLRLVFVTWGESRLLKEREDQQKLHRVEIIMDNPRYPEPLDWRNKVRDPYSKE